MPKTRTWSDTARPQYGGGVGDRDAEFLGAPLHVTDDAQARRVDANTSRRVESTMQRNKLSDRPSTSGGTARGSTRRNAEKRGTKDDLYFNPLGVHGSRTTFYTFLLPGSLPTPTSTPRSSPARTLSLPRSDTADWKEHSSGDLNLNLTLPQMEIGMALGSPTHPPRIWRSPLPYEASPRNETPDSVGTYVNNEPHFVAPTRQKASKWKLFGGLFGGSKRFQNGSPQVFYQLRSEASAAVQTSSEESHMQFGESALSETNPAKPRGRGRTNSQRKAEKKKPVMKRSHTAPVNLGVGQSSRGAAPQITLDGGPLTAHEGKRYELGGPLLDVDIPSIQMERYSIMFGSVLQKSAGMSSSLLARRQATLDRLKTVHEELAMKEQELDEKSRQLITRRATSPQPTRSPAFSLFPSTPSKLRVSDGSPSQSNGRNQLQRSNTSPAALSPSRPTFAPGLDNETHASLLGPGPHVRLVTEPEEITHRRTSKPSRQTLDTKSPVWSQEESHLILDSPVSDTVSDIEEETYESVRFPTKPKLNSPVWQIVNPQHVPTLSGVSATSSSRHSSSNSTSTGITSPSNRSRSSTTTTLKPQTHRPPRVRASSTPRPRRQDSVITTAFSPTIPPSNPGPALDISKAIDEEARLNSAAEISIARQISVSRQQRQLLVPISSSSPGGHASFPSPNSPSPLNTKICQVPLPLGVVGRSESARATPSPLSGKSSASREGEERGGFGIDRLVQASVKPATPTLVVVGAGEEEWKGSVMESPVVGGGGPGGGGSAVQNGLDGGRALNAGLGMVEMGGAHRKSERVVVERVSVDEG